MTIPPAKTFAGYQGQTAVLSRGLPVGRADEGDWGGTTTPGAELAAAATRPSLKGSQQGRWPNGPPKTNPGARASLHP
jgi:hypothetical protein